MKPEEVATFLLLAFIIVTLIFQILMYWERYRFVTRLCGKKIFDKAEKPLSRLRMVIEVFFPVNLSPTENIELIGIRKTATKYRGIWFVCLLSTFVIPYLIFKFLS